MRMTLEAFHTWSQHLRLSSQTEALIASIRLSRPIRRVSGRAGNITGRYPSPKMGVSIQFESDRVEFWAIYQMERDEDVDVNALLSRWRWFAEGCIGCIGVLKDWLVDAVAATLVQKGTSLTEEILTRTMPHPARRLSLEMEARAGQHKVALHNSESAKQFQALLRKPAKAANGKTEPAPGSMLGMPYASQAHEIAEPATATLPMPQVSPKPTQPRVGQRAPERDPVGDTAAPSGRKAIGCSFTEVIAVTFAQIGEAGVSRFECPTCLAVRDIPPRESV